MTALAGTVADLEGNPAQLTLPDPALAGLVGRNLRIDNIAPNAPVVQILDGGDEIINVADNQAGVAFAVTGEDGATYDLSGSNYSLIAGIRFGISPGFGVPCGHPVQAPSRSPFPRPRPTGRATRA